MRSEKQEKNQGEAAHERRGGADVRGRKPIRQQKRGQQEAGGQGEGFPADLPEVKEGEGDRAQPEGEENKLTGDRQAALPKQHGGPENGRDHHTGRKQIGFGPLGAGGGKQGFEFQNMTGMQPEHDAGSGQEPVIRTEQDQKGQEGGEDQSSGSQQDVGSG